MEKKTAVAVIGCLVLALLIGCAATESALKTVSEKAKQLQEKMTAGSASKGEETTPPPKESAAPPPKKTDTVSHKKSPTREPLKKSTPSAPAHVASPGYTYCKSPRNSFYQAYLSPEWNNTSFKYIAIDGLRYSRGIILNHVNNPNNDSIFFLKEGGGLGVELNKHFDIEIAFYPPDKQSNDLFKPFKIIVINRDDEVTLSEE
ncbi:MAG: hypothetical protein JXI32_06890, partial [Deltaproteobacteria bacterium]|nr:hypothetical protein [Deltaproteobacteria bacterium]